MLDLLSVLRSRGRALRGGFAAGLENYAKPCKAINECEGFGECDHPGLAESLREGLSLFNADRVNVGHELLSEAETGSLQVIEAGGVTPALERFDPPLFETGLERPRVALGKRRGTAVKCGDAQSAKLEKHRIHEGPLPEECVELLKLGQQLGAKAEHGLEARTAIFTIREPAHGRTLTQERTRDQLLGWLAGGSGRRLRLKPGSPHRRRANQSREDRLESETRRLRWEHQKWATYAATWYWA